MKQMLFIKTRDKGVATILLDNGYQLLDESNGEWTFLNEGSLKFSDNNENKEINNKTVLTNILTV